MLVFVLACAWATLAQGSAQGTSERLQVNTTEGLVTSERAVDGDYHVFFGIPYGGSVSGLHRFKMAGPPPAHPDVLFARNTDVFCAQPGALGLVGVEDCLALNVYTNNVTTPKPVFVWLHSNEYTTADTTMPSFRNFINEGILVVKMNFRLSGFGFLCLGVDEASGNAGLKDIMQGLQWVKNNIAGFGGDPNNIVLIGHGAGAALVDLITLSPKSQNLVHKAIAISGSALAPWAVAYDPIGYAGILGRKLSYDNKSPEQLADLLTTTNLNVLGSSLDGFKFTNNTPLFAPCLENKKLNDTFLTEPPIDILKSGEYNQVPYLGIYSTREGTLRAEQAAFDQWLEKMNANFSDFLQVDLDVNANRTAIAQSIKNFYFSGSEINMATIQDYLDYHGDTMVTVSVIRGASERAATSKSEVRLMEFGYMGTRNSDWSYNQIPLNGVKHGGILNYLLNQDLVPNDEVVMKSLMKRLADFGYNRTAAWGAEWPAITPDRLYYLQYSGNSANAIHDQQPKYDPHSIRMNFWNQLYATHYRPPSPVSSAGSLSSLLSVVFISFMLLKLL